VWRACSDESSSPDLTEVRRMDHRIELALQHENGAEVSICRQHCEGARMSLQLQRWN
jgi:hypothetical protein